MQYSLFYSQLCYFCHKVLNVLDQSALAENGGAIALLNINKGEHAMTLRQGGGKTQVPCLRIESSESDRKKQTDLPPVQWLYESDDIIAYLNAQGLTAN